jgi:2-oxoglutarate ferredoxin oxidoreductase subunit alpha
VEAFNLAERFRVPVVLLSEEAVGHLRERVSIPPKLNVVDRERDPEAPPFGTESPAGVPPMPIYGDGAKLLVTGSTHDEWGLRRTEDGEVHQRLVTRLSRKILDHRAEICNTEHFFVEDAETVLVSYGFTARSALYAVKRLRKRGHRVGMIRLQTLWPFPEETVASACENSRRILVPEMNLGQVEGEVRKLAPCPVEGYHQVNGEIIHPYTLMDWIMERLRS